MLKLTGIHLPPGDDGSLVSITFNCVLYEKTQVNIYYVKIPHRNNSHLKGVCYIRTK